MLGFNWIDLIIVILLILIVIEGVRVGFLTQICAITGFFVTLFIAGWLFPHLLPLHDHTLRSIVNGTLVLLSSAYAAVRGYDIGQHIHWSFRIGKRIDKKTLKRLESWFGVVPSIFAGLILVWLLGVAIGRLPFEGFSNSVSDSLIVQQLTRTLPSVPAVFGEFDREVDPNNQPQVFDQQKSYVGFNYETAAVQSAEEKAAASIVRVTSFGCGGVVSGSGFVVGPHLVATDAHVIAGVQRPIVKYGNQSYEGIPIVFNPNLDFAILRAQKLQAPTLWLSPGNATNGTTVAVLGYPGGNYSQTPGLIRSNFALSARNIYDEGVFTRNVYALQAHVDSGSSGSPTVLNNGQVAGIIFEKSTSVSDGAYALSSSEFMSSVIKAQTLTRRVNTGACFAG